MKIREFMPLIILDFLLLVTALINAVFFLPIEVEVTLPMLVFIVAAIFIYREERRKEELTCREEKGKKEVRFIKRLENFVKDFNDRIANSAYAYSLTSFALEIIHNKAIKQQKIAWQRLFYHLNEDLEHQGILLHKKIKQRNGDLEGLFKDFDSLLSLLRKFKYQFYEMVDDTKLGFSPNSRSEKTYKKFSEEFNRYMNKLEIFSDEVKAEFGLSLRKNLTEHVKDFSELYPPAVKL